MRYQGLQRLKLESVEELDTEFESRSTLRKKITGSPMRVWFPPRVDEARQWYIIHLTPFSILP